VVVVIGSLAHLEFPTLAAAQSPLGSSTSVFLVFASLRYTAHQLAVQYVITIAITPSYFIVFIGKIDDAYFGGGVVFQSLIPVRSTFANVLGY
jgi:hypothetical protein